MGLTPLLMLSALISPLTLVTAAPAPAFPLAPRQEADGDGVTPFVSDSPPEAGMMLDPPALQDQSQPGVGGARFKSFMQKSGANILSPGQTIEEILGRPKDGDKRTYDLDVVAPKSIKDGAAVKVLLQRSECETEKVEFYIAQGQEQGSNTTWSGLVQDLNKQKPEEQATLLKKGVSTAQTHLTEQLNLFFKNPDPSDPSKVYTAGLAPGAFPFPPTTMNIFGWSSVSGFQYSLQANPVPELDNSTLGNRTITVAALAFVNSGLASLAEQVNTAQQPLPLRQTAVAWVYINALQSLLDYAVKNLQDDKVSPNNKADVVSGEEAAKGFKAFSSGRYGSIRGDFATVKALQSYIDKGDKYPECFPLEGSGL